MNDVEEEMTSTEAPESIEEVVAEEAENIEE